MVSRSFIGFAAAVLICAGAWAGSGQIQPAPEQQNEANSSTLTWETRGDIFMAHKRYHEAIEAYKNSPQDSAVICNKTGIAYHQLMQVDIARRHYERAVRINPRYGEGLNNLGTVYYSKRNYRKAIRYYRQALEVNPRSASIYSNLGTAQFARKKYQEAVEAYQQALALDPEVFEHRSTQGVMLQERNVEERAKYHYYLAKLYAKTGNNDRALQYVRKALEEGFKDRAKLKEDPEFAAIRELPEFQQLLAWEPRVL
ncbi:MAG: tetratricopeptide repeat protein [Acidobacteria bacterium]|nr:tetratricopeptide repeat protein [Acidobacteriota bacterium]